MENIEMTNNVNTAEATTEEATTMANETKATKKTKTAKAPKTPRVINWGKLQLNDATTPTKFQCSDCGEWIEINTLDSRKTLPNAKRTGLCPTCYAKHVAARKAEAQRKRDEKAAAKAARPVSAFARVRTMLENATFSNEQVAFLTSKQKEFGLAYAMLIPADANVAYKDVAFRGNKARYARHEVTINSKNYYLTNHIYDKNVDRIRNALVKMGALDGEKFPLLHPVEPEAETEAVAEA